MPLTEEQINEFKNRLEAMKSKLSHSIGGNTQEVMRPSEATGYSQHQADQGTETFDRTISLEVTSKEYGLLKQINRAIEKIEESTYGICDVSAEEIPLARLIAIPYATMTVQSQEKFEKGLLSVE